MDKRSVKCLLKRYTDINKQVKRYSTPYTTVEFQIKIRRYEYTPIRIVKIQMLTAPMVVTMWNNENRNAKWYSQF